MSPAKSVMLLLALGVIFSTMVYCGDSFPATLMLEKIDLGNVEFHEVIARDRLRHDRVFESHPNIGVVDFHLRGSSNPYIYGRYFTRVRLGNPPRDYYVMIDTGSDLTWVNCNPCVGCPSTSGFIGLSFFDPHTSSSSAPVSCSDNICKLSVAQDHRCSSNSPCSYSIPYEDGSRASGYFVSDSFHFDTIIGNSSTAIVSANMVFGCSNSVSGGFTRPDTALDGIFGFGHDRVSVISQLASRGITPKAFSHCLKGEGNGGGILVLGEIVEPGMVYSPLVPKRPNYNLNLLSISISGQTVPINPKAFSTSKNRRGTIVDSGTSLAYLTEEAYDPFLTSLAAAVPPSVSSFPFKGSRCFLISSSIRDVFPLVILNFAGGASMILKPENYLLQNLSDVSGAWCVAFQKSQGITILGDLVLRDKIIVYDLARQRLGWVDYDCSSSVNVSLAPPGKDVSSSSRDANHYLYQLIPITTVCWLVVVYLFF